MNIESNIKLLKTLEEPPAYVHFILVSSNSNNLLPTILSRVQTIKFYPVEYDKIVDLLVTDHGKTYEEAKFIAEFTKGAVGKSISLSQDEEFFQRRDEILKTIDYLVKGDKTLALSQMDFFRDNKDDIDEILDIFLLWFRDLLLFKELGQVELLINKDKLNNLSSQSQVDIRSINDIIVRIEETKSNLRRNVNYDLAIQTMLLNIGGIQCNDKGSRSKI
jgi:DNA polymerase-3 subunit delta'